MRVATDSIYRNILQGLFTRSNDLNNIQQKVSSGKNINRPSDDPISMVSSLNFQTALSQVTQYSQNIQTGNLWLSSSETAISQASDLVTQAKQIATQMGTGDQTDASRTQAAAEVDQLLDQAVSLGNTQVAGKYIFAGYRTSTAPFSKTTDNNGVDTVTYNGDTNDFQIQVGTNEQVTVGKNGKAVFVDSNLFSSLETLKQAITNNDLPTIQQQVNTLQGTEDSLQTQLADVGIKQNRLTDNQTRLTQWSTNIQDQISNLQNVDYNQAIVELQQKQTAYEVALQSASQISQWNLQNASLFT